MKSSTVVHLISFVGLLVLIVTWTFLFIHYDPADIVDWLGITNTYVLTFTVGVLGALSSTVNVTTYPTIFTVTHGGVGPFWIVLLAATGLTIGDFLFIFFGISARKVLPDGFREFVERIFEWLQDKSDRFVQWFVFFWIAIVPIAHNLLLAPLAMTGFPAKKMTLPVFAGNVVVPLAIAVVGFYRVIPL